MTEYKLDAAPDGPVWDKRGDEWRKCLCVYSCVNWRKEKDGLRCSSWGDLLDRFGPLTDTPPIKEGDTGLTAEQVWDLPKGSVIWPELDEEPEPWMRFNNMWESFSDVSYGAGYLQCAVGDSFRVLILGGDK